jgi:hypothetical protein
MRLSEEVLAMAIQTSKSTQKDTKTKVKTSDFWKLSYKDNIALKQLEWSFLLKILTDILVVLLIFVKMVGNVTNHCKMDYLKDLCKQ